MKWYRAIKTLKSGKGTPEIGYWKKTPEEARKSIVYNRRFSDIAIEESDKAHTAEPWILNSNSWQGEVLTENGQLIMAFNDCHGYECDGGFMPEEVDLERMVACVNYCAGIPTDVLLNSTSSLLLTPSNRKLLEHTDPERFP